jgi:hypothetical protein
MRELVDVVLGVEAVTGKTPPVIQDDQAHFIRDFRAQVGFTPAAYARRCALGRGG